MDCADGRGADARTSAAMSWCVAQICWSTVRMSSAERVSRRRGRASGRPLRFLRAFLMRRDGVVWDGRWAFEMDGEDDGD